jgi:uracil-DNA glycosylase
MNAALTVEAGTPGSHLANWESITDALFDVCTHQTQPIVFILWGSYARKKKGRIYRENHFVIESAHPSPLSAHRGFFGSKPFSRANNYLKHAGSEPISWPLADRQFVLI